MRVALPGGGVVQAHGLMGIVSVADHEPPDWGLYLDTALACIAVRDGVTASGAVRWVRTNYQPHAVETGEQRALIERFDAWLRAS